MRLIIKGGKLKYKDLTWFLSRIRRGMMSKLQNSKELSELVEEVYISGMEVGFQFKIKGQEQLQELTSDSNEHGEAELLTIVVEVDEDGEIIEVVDNEKESMFDKKQAIIMKGDLPQDFQEIESSINPLLKVVKEEIKVKDFEVHFCTEGHDETFVWVQIYQRNNPSLKLIQEVKYGLDSEHTYEDLVNYYKGK